MPDAITLDIGLPDMDGWDLLDQLKRDHGDARNTGTRDLRSRAVAACARLRCCRASAANRSPKKQLIGAFDNLLGFADASARNVLVVEDDSRSSPRWPI